MSTDRTPSDLYERLGVSRDAGPAEIRSAWRASCFRYHPDTGGVNASAVRLDAAREAFRVLSDPARRTEYDRALAESEAGSGEEPPILSLENVLGNYEYLAGRFGRLTRRIWTRWFGDD